MADKTPKVLDPADTNKDGTVTPEELAAYQKTQSAYDVITHMFDNAGAPELGAWLAGAIKGDPSLLEKQNELFSQLQQSEPYKARFSGLVTLRQYNKDNPTSQVFVPSEAQYLATEAQMKDILKPVSDMYGTQTNTVIGNLIGAQISAAELQDRVTAANTWVRSQDPNIKEALKKFYSIGDNELLKLALDPTRGTAEIQRIAGATELGAQAFASHIDLTKQQSEGLISGLLATGKAADSVTAGQLAASKLQDITTGTATAYNPEAGTLKGVQTLAKIEGTDLAASDVLGAALGINTEVAGEVRGLKSRERARFEGGSAGTNVLQQNVSGTV